jgi:organic radical activating enzyme
LEISSISEDLKLWVKQIEIELLDKCNLECPLCARNYVKSQKLLDGGYLELLEWKNIVDSFPNLNKVVIAGIISEPTMYPFFLSLVEFLVSKDLEIEINTNGSTRNKSFWRDLGSIINNNEKVNIFFTICGSNQELHSKYRKNSDLSVLLDNVKSFKEYSNRDVLQYIIFEYNKNDYKSKDMEYIKNIFSMEKSVNSLPYYERFKFVKKPENDIHTIEELSNKYKILQKRKIKKPQIICKSKENSFLEIDNKGQIFPCFVYRLNRNNWDGNFDEIEDFKYSFCYECDKFNRQILENNNMEIMS